MTVCAGSPPASIAASRRACAAPRWPISASAASRAVAIRRPLGSLVRSVALHREGPHGWVELEDTVGFASALGQCESVLTTFSGVEFTPGAVIIRGEKGALRVSYDPAVVTPRLEVEKDVDFGIGPADVNVILFSFNHKVQQGVVRLKIEPAE